MLGTVGPGRGSKEAMVLIDLNPWNQKRGRLIFPPENHGRGEGILPGGRGKGERRIRRRRKATGGRRRLVWNVLGRRKGGQAQKMKGRKGKEQLSSIRRR